MRSEKAIAESIVFTAVIIFGLLERERVFDYHWHGGLVVIVFVFVSGEQRRASMAKGAS